MTASASTRRIRLTQGLFLLLVAVVAVSGGRAFDGAVGLALQAVGFVLVAWGTLFRVWSTAFIAGRKDVELVRDGPYARCRHPLYLGSLVATLGLALSTRSLVLAVVLPLALATLYAISIRREERFLLERHGGAWRDYAAGTPMLWPRRGRPRPPGRREVDLTIYRKAFLDAGAVLGLWGVIVAADALRRHGAWGELFRLP